jgi:hypothetical protein
LLLGSQTDLLFHRQLRIARATEPFAACLALADTHVGEAFLRLWATAMGLPGRLTVSRQLYELTVENFYLRLPADDRFDRAWLVACVTEVQQLGAGLRAA